jgi:uncharacterized protein YfbU (UPF0304 family)
MKGEAMEELSKIERMVLINQYRILGLLDKENAADYERSEKVLRKGYSIYYSDVLDVYDGLSETECRFVVDTLDVYRVLNASYKGLPDKSGINEDDLEFKGFDGNDETSFMVFAEFLKEDDKWQEILTRDDLNTHYSTQDKYQQMIVRYKVVRGRQKDPRHELTKEEIQEVLGAS